MAQSLTALNLALPERYYAARESYRASEAAFRANRVAEVGIGVVGAAVGAALTVGDVLRSQSLDQGLMLAAESYGVLQVLVVSLFGVWNLNVERLEGAMERHNDAMESIETDFQLPPGRMGRVVGG